MVFVCCLSNFLSIQTKLFARNLSAILLRSLDLTTTGNKKCVEKGKSPQLNKKIYIEKKVTGFSKELGIPQSLPLKTKFERCAKNTPQEFAI
jgi:hypothetical protein